ncbi:RNA polymerase sigma factor [Streptomyces sp. OR43]|uniref:RNA polymerase sigma factor n=1 Tax=Streptomyces sp. or43 TaxID=2478957 RepID=UPI0011CE728E|nr:RNA polymerase sigma factor [Streptomyces sp. or43]TXS43671.1 RNA polymerase sigma factor [Streptomyces sp. or43]
MRRRLRAGDREAFAELYESCAQAVYRHALRLTGDWSTAEDIMADTFLAAWQGRERLEEDRGSPLPWLLGIATHKWENTRRGLRRRRAFLARQPAPAAVADFSAEAASRLDDRSRLRAVSTAFGRLRRHEQEVLSLRVWSGLDYEQTADALGVPVSTVRSRLSRARRRLARIADQAERTERPRRNPEPARARGEVCNTAAIATVPLREETR